MFDSRLENPDEIEAMELEAAPVAPPRGLRANKLYQSMVLNTRSSLTRTLLRLVGEEGGGAVSVARWRRALVTTLTTFGARGLSILTGLISVPLTLRYLGQERYGMWMTISSAVVMLIFADLGLGNGVVNAVSQADGADDRRRAAEAVSSAFFMLSGLALALAALFALLLPVVPWERVFNVTSPEARAELPWTVAIIVGNFILSLPLGVVQRVQIGYQEGYRNNLWRISGNIAGLVGILVAIYLEAGLPWLVLCMTGAQTVALFFNFIHQFYRVRTWLRPRWSLVDWATCHKLMRVGLVFCGLTVATLLGTGTDDLIIANVCGSAAVAQYDVVYKLSSLTLVIQYFTVPLWPAFSEAQARGDGRWLRTAFRRTTAISLLMATVMCLLLLVSGRFLVNLWVGAALVPSFALLLGFCCYKFVTGLSEAAVSLLNTPPLLHTHIWIAGIAGIVGVGSKFIAAHYAGVEGVIWATALTYGICFSLPAVIAASMWTSRFAPAAAVASENAATVVPID